MNQKYPLKKTQDVSVTTFTSPESEHELPYPGEILFKLEDWQIHSMIEAPEICEAFHYCNRPDKAGIEMAWSYQLPNDSHCPGCNAIQPDEIQGLVAMYNFDKPASRWGKSQFQAKRMQEWNRIFAEHIRKQQSRITGVTA